MSLEFGFRNVSKHRGTWNDFGTRYEQLAYDAVASGPRLFRLFCDHLPMYVSDERNLMAALHHLRRRGGPAAGLDGVQLADLSTMECWSLVRDLRDRLRNHTFGRGPLKRCRIRKESGRGTRTVYIANLEDRVVARGAAQVLAPILSSAIDPHEFTWRGRGTQAALAYAVEQVAIEGRTTWVTEDWRDAFDNLPRARLFQILRSYVPNFEFCSLVETLAARPARRGILQGSALSSLLLGLYSSHRMHRPWRGGAHRPPLATYADDLWVGCTPDEDVRSHYQILACCSRAAGMKFKHGPEAGIIDLREQSATWLGYRLRLVGGQLTIHSDRFPSLGELRRARHERLVAQFARLHQRASAWRSANALVRGIVNYLAPTLPFENPERIYERINSAAGEAGFDEIMNFDELLAHWQAGHARWVRRLNAANRAIIGPV